MEQGWACVRLQARWLSTTPYTHCQPSLKGPASRFAHSNHPPILRLLAPAQRPSRMGQASQLLCQGHLGPVRPAAWGWRLPGQDRVPVGARGCPTAPGPSGPVSTRWQHARTEARRAALSGPGPSTALGSLALIPGFCCRDVPYTVREPSTSHLPPAPHHSVPLGPPACHGQLSRREGVPQVGQGEAQEPGASGALHRLLLPSPWLVWPSPPELRLGPGGLAERPSE